MVKNTTTIRYKRKVVDLESILDCLSISAHEIFI